MEPIGALKIQKQEKEVTNKPDWCPGNPETGKRGRQWSRLVP
ncbi:hypothetical protein [Bacillus sp. ISL-41]|nr:hypothetical protein [Bacillus sp. ISL-41]